MAAASTATQSELQNTTDKNVPVTEFVVIVDRVQAYGTLAEHITHLEVRTTLNLFASIFGRECAVRRSPCSALRRPPHGVRDGRSPASFRLWSIA